MYSLIITKTSFYSISIPKYYLLVIASTHISVNLFLKAGDNSLFPKSPPGFIVATITKPFYATIDSACNPPFSGNNKLLSLSNTEFNRSNTLSSANEISSIKNTPP
jgi:hypothetical protein